MKSINFEEHYVVEDIQKETMKHMTSYPKGVPMQTMLKGLEEKSGFTDADEIKHHDARIQFMDKYLKMARMILGPYLKLICY